MEPIHIPAIPAGTFPLPPRLEGLRRLAYNLHWAWDPRTRNLWSLIDRIAWNRYRNPIPVIAGATSLTRILDDEKFLAEYHDALSAFDDYMANGAGQWFSRKHREHLSGPIAYFCAEYGIHESLGIYSGGLGVLAGDHMKSASDMALPFVGVGLLYRRGYFRQQIDADGHQEHNYADYDLNRLPLSRVQDRDGLPLTVSVELPGRELSVAVWLAQVGRVPVLLLDTDVAENAVEDRPITHILYVRGREMRLHQVLVLGIGGVRALRALGLDPAVWHLNEGHSAFLLTERAREFVAAGSSLEDAWRSVRRNSVFTIHTPVSAGNERFDANLVRRVAGPLLETDHVPIDEVLALGEGPDGDHDQFDMTAFSLRLTHGANAVSQLHAETANRTWQAIAQRPILGVTNGVHGPSWVGQPVLDLLSRH
jgi:alpha-glucan phosphorylase-like protein